MRNFNYVIEYQLVMLIKIYYYILIQKEIFLHIPNYLTLFNKLYLALMVSLRRIINNTYTQNEKHFNDSCRSCNCNDIL